MFLDFKFKVNADLNCFVSSPIKEMSASLYFIDICLMLKARESISSADRLALYNGVLFSAFK